MADRDMEKAALRGEPSYVWRSGQERRLQMIAAAAGERLTGRILENGCGVGLYLDRLSEQSQFAVGLEFDLSRAQEAHVNAPHIVNAAGEKLPLPAASFDFILNHEVLEHVLDDRKCVEEMVRVLAPGGRMAIFVPNRGYPFETHGIYWGGSYHFGNIPLVNYLPRKYRDRLAPHVRIYSSKDLKALFSDLPVRIVQRQIIFGAYDNIIARTPTFGRLIRGILQDLENSPARLFGLSHFWVLEKI
ncbi:MAG TPA: class I SAM-dependent methyltransferase [Anaerolineales bacterium]|nr:class I SAM-dependent methyltransferase [Anaerolineales bacterium]